MQKHQQLSLLKKSRKGTKRWWIEEKAVYGGSINYRKIKRPFSERKLNHVVFKARLGRGIWFTRSQRSISHLLASSTKRYNLNLKSFAINKDHIHVLVWGGNHESFVSFLRFFSAEMGRKYGNIFKRFGQTKRRNLWVHRPFTRQVSWAKKSLTIALNYLQKNRDEAWEFISYTPRRHQLSASIAKWTKPMMLVGQS